MLNNFVTILALRYFFAKNHERFLSIISSISLIGIMIGVAALVIVMSVMNGFHVELTSNMIGLNGDITITPKAKVIEDESLVQEVLESSKFVTHKTYSVIGQALAVGPRSTSGVLVRGIDLRDLSHKGSIIEKIVDGSFAEYQNGSNSIALGLELARSLGVSVGSKLKLISPNMLSTSFGSMPRAKDFTVIAIFNSGMFDYDSVTALVPRETAQKFLALEGRNNLIELNVDESVLVSEYSEELRQQLGGKFFVRSWMQNNQQFLSALEVERAAMFVILSLIILVAAFNIVASLFMLVKDKTKDIAILRTIGASKQQIMLVFMVSGMMIGVIGTFFGVTLGVLIASNIERIRTILESISGVTLFDPAIYFLYNLPSVLRVEDVVLIAVLALILSLLATIYPAYKASKLNPVEAMRYE